MVERIEGFCQEEEWKRAYHEMNEMEEQLAHHGTIVLKFWMHIDKDEQERRFKERMENPQSSGRLPMRTGATVRNGMLMKRQWMKC